MTGRNADITVQWRVESEGAMALFIDGPVSTIEELAEYESSILEVARTEGIDLAVKLRLAHEELAIEMESLLTRAAEDLRLENVVVTEAVHKWHTFHSLSLVFRDGFHQQLNDRYLAKWREYHRLAQWACDALLRKGIGVTKTPIPKAERPQIGTAQGAAAAATYYFRVAWRNAAGEEGKPSEAAVVSLADGSVPVVRPANAPATAVGWNVYAGFAISDLTLQTASPVSRSESWTMPASGLVQGAPSGDGQAPQYFVQPQQMILRG
jgi:hypothetical protein